MTMHYALHVPKQTRGRLRAEPGDIGKLHCVFYSVMPLFLEVRHTFIQLKLHLSFNICHMPCTCLHLTTGLVNRLIGNKVFKCKILGSNNELNACESLQMSGEILHFIFKA